MQVKIFLCSAFLQQLDHHQETREGCSVTKTRTHTDLACCHSRVSRTYLPKLFFLRSHKQSIPKSSLWTLASAERTLSGGSTIWTPTAMGFATVFVRPSTSVAKSVIAHKLGASPLICTGTTLTTLRSASTAAFATPFRPTVAILTPSGTQSQNAYNLALTPLYDHEIAASKAVTAANADWTPMARISANALGISSASDIWSPTPNKLGASSLPCPEPLIKDHHLRIPLDLDLDLQSHLPPVSRAYLLANLLQLHSAALRKVDLAISAEGNGEIIHCNYLHQGERHSYHFRRDSACYCRDHMYASIITVASISCYLAATSNLSGYATQLPHSR